MDQTPIAFHFLSKIFKATRLWVKEQRSGWDRQQATLQVCVYAGGVRRIKLLLIFHRDPFGDSRGRIEEKLYNSRVCVTFNKTTWADSLSPKDSA